ncbi:hypothetical protein Q8F55_004429 [Vanrija albida]|uniref:DUF427 domain-containing protein n=1 Tax=Vanrija albida TaxID=181172 RepID=A0ABR3Q7U8_9TREE
MPIPAAPKPDHAIPKPPAESDVLQRRRILVPGRFEFEPTSRWVRGIVGDVALVDSRHQILVWEPGYKVPEYAYPSAHVRTDLLVASGEGEEPTGPPSEAAVKTPSSSDYWRPRWPDVQWFDAVVGGRTIQRAAWKWNVPGLEDFIAVSWYPGVLDAWYEEDEAVHTHPRDPGNRVDVIPSQRHIKVVVGGEVLAESRAALVLFEHGLPTRFYLPREDVRIDLLDEVPLVTQCPYKGYTSSYWRRKGTQRDIAWTYGAPVHQVSAIKDRIAFFNDRVELIVDGEPFVDSPKTWA